LNTAIDAHLAPLLRDGKVSGKNDLEYRHRAEVTTPQHLPIPLAMVHRFEVQPTLRHIDSHGAGP
jgi:hypothetical protein